MKADPVEFLLCCIGVAIFFWLWRHDILSASLILKILRAEI
jgi:hypothetical protein